MCRGGQEDLLWDEPELISQPPSVRSQPGNDDLADAWADLANESDEMGMAAPSQAMDDDLADAWADLLNESDEMGTARLGANSDEMTLKTPPAPRQRAGSVGVEAWAARRSDASQRGATQRGRARLPLRDASAPSRSGWTTSGDELSGARFNLVIVLVKLSEVWL